MIAGSSVLDVSGLNAFYGWAHILFDLSLEVGQGEVVVLLGRNGAGKSTTLKSIVGLVRPAGGSVRFQGVEIAGRASHRIARAGLGYVPEERRIFTDLTVAENLEVGRQPRRPGAPEWTTDALYRMFPNLAEMQGRSASQMSGGEQQMLTIARTLMGNPSLILLDEPSEGLAPVIVDQMAVTIRELKSRGLSVLLSEQNLRFARMVCDRAYIIEKGRIQWQGTMPDLDSDEDARRQYLSV
jgi:branched-chain amino acid transport system ATP-binding protein